MNSSIKFRYIQPNFGIIIWTILLVLINFSGFIIAINKKFLIGDLNGVGYSSIVLLFASTFYIISSILIFFILFKFALKIPVLNNRDHKSNNLASFYVGFYIFTFIVYVNHTGAFIAASSFKGGDVLSALFSIISPDAIFLIYFASRKNRSYLDPVLFLWIFSSLQRGWIGLIFSLFAIKAFEMIRDCTINFKILFYFIIIISIYPFVDILKLYIRIVDNFNIFDFLEHFVSAKDVIDFNFINSISNGIEKFIARLQLISHATYIEDNKFYFDLLILNGELVPFWKEGIYGIAWDRVFGINHQIEVPQALAALIDPTNSSSWNVNPSIIGWFSIYSNYFPFTFIYLAAIVITIVLLAKSISKDPVFINFTYLLISTLLIPGWIAQLITFTNAFFVFFIISLFYKLFIKSFETKKFNFKN